LEVPELANEAERLRLIRKAEARLLDRRRADSLVVQYDAELASFLDTFDAEERNHCRVRE
jgi:hypothetical protein